jgi:drug/metabolite transporter (DMT)-like permease
MKVKTMEQKRQLSDKEKVLKAGWIVAIGLMVICFSTTILLWFNGILYLEVPIAIMMILVFVYPILFFFLGIYIVMKKKFFPMKKSNPDQEPQQE